MKTPYRHKATRKRAEENNPTVVIHRLLDELQQYIEAYEEIAYYIGRYPEAPVHKLPMHNLTHYEYARQRERRKILTLKASEQNRLNMRLARMRLDAGHRTRGNEPQVDTNTILAKVGETFQPLSETEQALIHLGWPRNEAIKLYSDNPEGAAAIVQAHGINSLPTAPPPKTQEDIVKDFAEEQRKETERLRNTNLLGDLE